MAAGPNSSVPPTDSDISNGDVYGDDLEVILASMSIVSLLLLIVIWVYFRYVVYLKEKSLDGSDGKITLAHLRRLFNPKNWGKNPTYTANSRDRNVEKAVPKISNYAITNLEKLGEGFFGVIYKGEYHITDADGIQRIETVAIKMLKPTTNLELEQDFLREVETISSFEHPNILSLIGLCPVENTIIPWMIFEFMSLGDLANVLRKSSLVTDKTLPVLDLTPELLLSMATQIAEGMEYLANQRFVHRDLACRNCLVNNDFLIKISDFGMSRDVYFSDYYQIGKNNKMLPVRWMAPESVVFGRFTLESDIWSYGVVLWEIYSHGKLPYYGHNNNEVLQFIHDGVLLAIPDDWPEEIADIMGQCWKHDVDERLAFSDICKRLSKMTEFMEESDDEQSSLKSSTLITSTHEVSIDQPPSYASCSGNAEPVDLLDKKNY